MEYRRVGFFGMCVCVYGGRSEDGREWRWRQSLPSLSVSLPPHPHHFQVDYMDENEEYFQRQASHRQSRRRFRKINQKGERQTIIDTVDPYPTGKPPIARGYHTVSCSLRFCAVCLPSLRWIAVNPEATQCCSVCVSCFSFFRLKMCTSCLTNFVFGSLSWPSAAGCCVWMCCVLEKGSLVPTGCTIQSVLLILSSLPCSVWLLSYSLLDWSCYMCVCVCV